MVDKAAKKRVQAGIDRSRKAAAKARKLASKSTGAERASLLREAADYEAEAEHYVRTCADLGVK